MNAIADLKAVLVGYFDGCEVRQVNSMGISTGIHFNLVIRRRRLHHVVWFDMIDDGRFFIRFPSSARDVLLADLADALRFIDSAVDAIETAPAS